MIVSLIGIAILFAVLIYGLAPQWLAYRRERRRNQESLREMKFLGEQIWKDRR